MNGIRCIGKWTFASVVIVDVLILGRIYMENCKYGSLEGLIKAYRENNARGARDQDGNLLNA